jgi:Fe-S cluster biogenesis protein NfuA
LSLKETMTLDTAIQQQMQRIGEIVEQLESNADPSTRAMAKDLVEALMAMHGAALQQILELAADAGEPGETFIRKCGRDDLISSVLLLYGLHPENLRSRVTYALEKTRNALRAQSASAELLSVSDDGAVTVRLEVKSTGCGSSAASVKATLEAALYNAAPDAMSIVINETDAAFSGSGFVSVSQLQSAQAMTATAGAPSRQGD